MRIEHIALFVQDLEREKDFFVTYFHAAAGAKYQNIKTGFCSYFLTFDDGARLELMHRSDLVDMDKKPERTGYAHLAFCVGTREAVNQLTLWLEQDGYSVVSPLRVTGDGYYESCVLDAEGNRIEITAGSRSSR